MKKKSSESKKKCASNECIGWKKNNPKNVIFKFFNFSMLNAASGFFIYPTLSTS